MKNIKQLAIDARDMGNMMLALADDLDRLAAIDLSALQLLFGSEPEPSEVKPTEASPKGPDVQKPKRQRRMPLAKPLTKTQKDQIRLLWAQSDKNKATMLPKLVDLYQSNKVQISAILFNKPGELAHQKALMKTQNKGSNVS